MIKRDRSRRLYQISLRSSLLIVSAVCIATALYINQVRSQQVLASKLRAKGLVVFYDHELAESSGCRQLFRRWVSNAVGPDFASTLVGAASVSGERVADVSEVFEGRPQMRFLAIYSGNLDVADAERIAGLENVTMLHLNWTKSVTDNVALKLASMKQLEVLDLSGTSVSRTAVDALKAKLPHCNVVSDFDCPVKKEVGGSDGGSEPGVAR